jgi:pyruvate/2-oxoglutarate dehydrogenase complex dihydrolipoamide acyltransferase (E2) component
MSELETIRMPRLGIAMTEGAIVEWLKAEGESIGEGELLLLIESDKAQIEIPSPCSGILEKILAQVDEVIPVLEPIAQIRLLNS